MAYNAELQMLRELSWFLLPQFNCRFCGRRLLDPIPGLTFGHRRHVKIRRKLTIHHEDENRENNSRTNLRLSHSSCHRRHHGGKQKEEKEEEGRVLA